MAMPNIVHQVSLVGKNSCGLGQVVNNLANAQLIRGNDVNIWCVDNQENILWAEYSSGFPRANIVSFPLFGPSMLMYSRKMVEAAKYMSSKRIDIFHQHGIFAGISSATLMLNQHHNIPVIIAPHGSLNSWALSRSRMKKFVAFKLYELRNLHEAACLHATSENEIRDFRDFGLKNPIALIDNGVSPQKLATTGCAENFRKNLNLPADRRMLFFLSRISPKKGLSMLVESIARLKDEFGDWMLVIAGIDEFGHKADIENLVVKHGLTDKIRIIGPLFDQDCADAFAAAELFILPSYSEGSPMVVLDSLAAGVPVITTKASSWKALDSFNAGWWVDISVDAIITALRAALNMNPHKLRIMGQNGKALVASHYTWDAISQQTEVLYSWLLGQVSKPDFVFVN